MTMTTDLTAAAWEPDEHPRGSDGRFIKAGALLDFLKQAKPTTDKVLNAVDEVDGEQWKSLKPKQQKHIADSVAKLPDTPLTKKAKAKVSALGGDVSLKPTVKKASAPAKSVIPADIYKKHGDGDVVAKSDGTSLVWNAGTKKYDVQDETGQVKRSLTKGAAYQEVKDGKWGESKASTKPPKAAPSPIEKTEATTVEVSTGSMPVVPATIYKQHPNGFVAAESPSGNKRLRWDEASKKWVVESRDGNVWKTDQALTKTAAYAVVKDSSKWIQPSPIGTKNGSSSSPETPEPAPAVVESTAESVPVVTPHAPAITPTVITPIMTSTPDVPDNVTPKTTKIGNLEIGDLFTMNGRIMRLAEYKENIGFGFAKDVYSGEQITVVDSMTVTLPRQKKSGSLSLNDTLNELDAIFQLSKPYAQTAAEVTHKAGTGKILTDDDLKKSNAADKALATLRAEAEPFALSALEMLAKRDGEPWGSLDTAATKDQWAKASKPAVVDVPGVDAAKREKVRNEYVVNDKKTIAMNASLRSGDPSTAAKGWRGRMNNMVNSSTFTHDSLVYRGAAFVPQMISQLRPGAILHEPAIMSTDEDKSSANFYANTRLNDMPGTIKTVFTIRVPKGTSGVDVGYGEFVFGTGSGLRIISSEMVNGVVEVVAEMIAPPKKGKK